MSPCYMYRLERVSGAHVLVHVCMRACVHAHVHVHVCNQGKADLGSTINLKLTNYSA